MKEKEFEKNMFWDYTQENNSDFGISASSLTDCTGLIPAAPSSEDELEAYNELYQFTNQDVPAKEDTLKNPINKL